MSRRCAAVYRGARHLGADFLLGGSGHNAGVINPPAANKHGYWTRPDQPEDVEKWLAGANRHEGSWWPWWTELADQPRDSEAGCRPHHHRRNRTRARPLRQA